MTQIISVSSKDAQNFQKNTLDSGVLLGNTPIHEPVTVGVACSELKENLIIDQEGVIKTSPDASENRLIRYSRQSASRKLLPEKRVAKCLRSPIAKTVKIFKSKYHGKCHFGDLMICGSIWDCPVCAAKISERRRVELKTAVKQHESFGGSVYLITFTYSHKKQDDLDELLSKQAKAMQWFYRHRTYKELAKRYQKQGRVRALEVNYGDHGWHPHIHELWFLDLHLQDFATLKLEIFNLWLKACQRYDLGLPSWEHGVDVRSGGDAAYYVSKFGLEDKKSTKAWGIENELTKASSKKGRNGSRSPFQLLDDYIDGDKKSGSLFFEYSKAFHGKRQLTWSRGLKAVFDLDIMTDEELAHQKEDEADLLAELTLEQWRIILRSIRSSYEVRCIILTICENGGVDALNQFMTDLVSRYKQSH